MNLKSLIFVVLCFCLKFDLYSQTELYKLQIKIYPDTSNLDGCFFTSEELNPILEPNKTAYKFNLKHLIPADDNELYFGDFINSECKIVFYNNQLTEKVLNESAFIEPEIEINTAPLLVSMNVSKKTATNSKKKHELNINLSVPSLLTPDDKLLKIIINLTPIEQ